jgi:3-hydroxybutyryl-CoA dehydrogenase
MTARPISADATVMVIGAGSMGAGIAQVAARAGQKVLILDSRPGAARKAIEDAAKIWDGLVQKGRLTETQRGEALGRLQEAGSIDEAGSAELVVEAIAENIDIKREIFRSLEKAAGAEVILASNTSSLSITAIAAGMEHPDRFVGMHFFNPAPVLPLVEIISGLATNPAVAARTFATARAWGKVPVHARSTPGFIVNRVARPFYAEAWRLLQVDAIDPATLDAIMVESGGFKMGPCALMDLIGHDVNAAVSQSVFQAFDFDRRFQPSMEQREFVAAGWLGRKSGRGFFRYGPELPTPSPDDEPDSALAAPVSLKAVGRMGAAQALVERFANSGILIEYELNTGARSALVGEGMQLVLCDGRSASQIAFEEGQPNTIIFDLALDYSKAKRVALARASSCSDFSYATALALFQKAGFAVSRVGDVPGMPVVRTVAMLVNEAADAVFQNVCSMADCDTAMKMGTNYPLGPFEWGQAVGVDFIVRVLRNLHDVYGEERYRVSPLLQHKLWTGKTFYG